MIAPFVLCGSLAATAANWRSADERAAQISASLTRAERLALVEGELGVSIDGPAPKGAVGSAGFVPGIPRLHVPALQESDASLGITNPANARAGDVATAMPSGLALASTWDPQIAYDGGAAIGDEAWRKGLNVLLGPGLDLTRDPRNGRNFEYLGEDPLLAGTMAGASICGIQAQHVVATMKHYALNDQETGRTVLSANIGESAMRESDLLAFEIALEDGRPGAVMCAYNKVNGVYSCENAHLLNDVLKRDWSFQGWVMSDWGAVHSVNAAANGLDQESAAVYDKVFNGTAFFGAPLAAAVASGALPASRLADMDRRILRSMLAIGLFDRPARKSRIDYAAHAKVALEDAERGIVLLKDDGVLPIAASVRRIAVIGGHADAGVIAGGGSSQVTPVDGAALEIPLGGEIPAWTDGVGYDPSSPLAALRNSLPHAQVSFTNGRYPNVVAALASHADVAIVFATQWNSEAVDDPSLTLPEGQDALIDEVAAANPHTIVVLETGNPVFMPWLHRVSAVMEAWYPGQRGGEAIANVLLGNVDAAGRLPITFPASDDQLAHPVMPGFEQVIALLETASKGRLQPFSVAYPEGSDVGYRRYVKQNLKPLFAFGYGLSYTTFRYGNLRLHGGDALSASFDVTNTGSRVGTATPQLYLTRKAGAPEMRLLGWSQVTLAPGQTRGVQVTADPRLLADFDASADVWTIRGGAYQASLGAASDDLPYQATVQLTARTIALGEQP